MEDSDEEYRSSSIYWTVKTRLIHTYKNEPTIAQLKELADKIHKEKNVPITRDIKRNKKMLLTWLCDNWNVVQIYLKDSSDENEYDTEKIISSARCGDEKKRKLMDEFKIGIQMNDVLNQLKNIFNKEKFTMKELKDISNEVCKKTNLKLNRNEKRDKGSNLAWFANNWEIIEPIMYSIKKSGDDSKNPDYIEENNQLFFFQIDKKDDDFFDIEDD